MARFPVLVNITYNIVVSIVSVFMKLNLQNNIFEVPVVPKIPEPEKKAPPPGLKKAVPPPAKGTSLPTGMCLRPSTVELGCSSRRDGCST